MNVGRGQANATTYVELPTFFGSNGNALFGIVTLPAGVDAHTGVVIIGGAGTPVTTGRNRILVRMSRELAALGYAALRFDFHGTGESTGSSDRWDLGHPFVDDLAAAVSCLRNHGIVRVVLLGSCYGARSALAGAATLDVEELILFSTPIRDFAARGEGYAERTSLRRSIVRYVLGALRRRTIRDLFDRRHRQLYGRFARVKLRRIGARIGFRGSRVRPTWAQAVGPNYRHALEQVGARSMPVLFVYGTDDRYYQEFVAAKHDLAATLERASSIRLVTMPGRLHGFTNVEVQEASIELIRDWASTRGTEASFPNSAAADRQR